MSVDNLTWLQQWYLSRCNGEWEHQFGIRIENLDNPGWRLTVDLAGTELQGREFKALAIDRTPEDGVRCKVVGTRDVSKYEACGGALNLGEMIEIFRRWVQA